MRKIIIFSAVLLALTGLCRCTGSSDDNSVQTETDADITGIVSEEDVQSANTGKDAGLLVLESNIFTSEPDSDSEFGYELYDDLDGDGENELLAVYGDSESHGSLWYSDSDSAVKLYGTQNWDNLRTLNADGDILFLAERVKSDTGSVSYCYRADDGVPVLLKTSNVGNLTQTDGDNFVGNVTAVDGCTDGTGETSKPYWFCYKDGIFGEYFGSLHTYDAEEIGSDTDFLLPYFDEISKSGGEVQSYIIRPNGIVNINYNVKAEDSEFLAYRYFRTLYVDGKNVTDITPESNSGQYTSSASGNLTDAILY
jgi:hypothetical protein